MLATLALSIISNSPTWIFATMMLWVMDASINISMEPFRAFVGDMLSSEQRTSGFAMQSFFIGIGAVIGGFLPMILANLFNVPSVPAEGKLIPFNVKLSFYIGAAVLLLAVLWTIITTKEYSPEELAEFEEAHKQKINTQSKEINALSDVRFYRPGIIWLVVGLVLTFVLSKTNLEKELYVITGGVTFFGFLQMMAGLMKSAGKGSNGLNSIMTDLKRMPSTMSQLAVVQFFTWFALFSMWIYTTSAVTSQIYGTSDTTSIEYNKGANWVSGLFAIYSGCAALVAFLLPVMAKATSRRWTHSICLVIGGISLISISLVKTPMALIFPMIGIGIAWASILSMPYAILTGSLPHNKMGIYMGIFNFFIVIPQILAASILGSMVKHFFHGNTMNALITGGISMLIAALMVKFVRDIDDKK
jgi:maltose/moltooligosaccharide transporter